MIQVINNLMKLLENMPIKTCCDNCGMEFHVSYFHNNHKVYRNDKGDIICMRCKQLLKRIRENKNVNQLTAGGNHE